MTQIIPVGQPPQSPPPPRATLARFQPFVLLGLVLAAVVLQRPAVAFFDTPALRTWATMFIAIVVQALPFLVVGVILAAVISTVLSERLLARIVPKSTALSVPAAGLAGVALPGCECASVPMAGGLMRRGIGAPTALTFVLAAPAVNPIVLVTTAVAFPAMPEMVWARFAASLTVAVVVGWLWVLVGKRVPLRLPHVREHERRWHSFIDSVQHDLLHTGGFLVLGAAIAAVVNTFLPVEILDLVASDFWLSIAALAGFAFIVAICSEADAFVAASLSAFSPVAQLTFMVVGPAMDVKLAALHTGTFGHRFARVFVPLTVVVAIASAVFFGEVIL